MSQVSKREFQTLRGQVARALMSFNAQLAEVQYTLEAQGLAIVEELKLEPARLAAYRKRVDALHEQIRAAGALGAMLYPLGDVEVDGVSLREIGTREGMYVQPDLRDLYELLSPTPPAPPSLLARLRARFRRPAQSASTAPGAVLAAERQAA